MKRRRKQLAEPQLVEFWQARSATLDQNLRQAPAASEAWFWQIQFNIVHYLLERYASPQIRPEQKPVQRIDVPELPETLHHTPMEVRPSDSFIGDVSAGNWPRAAEEIRPFLQTIADVNQGRRNTLQRPRGKRAMARRVSVDDLPKAISDDPDDKTGLLNADEIADILSGKLEVEPLPEDWGTNDDK